MSNFIILLSYKNIVIEEKENVPQCKETLDINANHCFLSFWSEKVIMKRIEVVFVVPFILLFYNVIQAI